MQTASKEAHIASEISQPGWRLLIDLTEKKIDIHLIIASRNALFGQRII
jgi:hypothetical protein